MPDKVIQVPGVGNVSFPDSMADEDIATAISSHMNSGPPATHGIWDKANEYAGKALSAAGLPKSIADVPDWFKHLTGTHKESQPFWEPVRNAIKNPTQENIVAAVPFVGPAAVSMSKDVRAGDYGGAAATLAGTVGGVKAAGQVEPGLQAVKQTVLPGQGTVAEGLYQSALKPPPGSYSSSDVTNMVKTGLKEELPVSAKGVQKLNDLVRGLNRDIQGTIDAGSERGVTVNKYSVTGRLGSTVKKFANQVNPEADLNAVSQSGNEFLRNQPVEIPASDAQAIKQGTYRQLGDKAYGELSSAAKESQKALARGIKEELAEQFPEISALNARESQLFGLQDALERAVRRINNHDIISLGSKVASGAGAAVAGAPGAVAAGVLEKVLGMPAIKSRLAIILNRKGIPMGTATAKVAAYATALENAQPENATDSSANSLVPVHP